MFLHYRVQTDHRGLAHLTIRMSFEQNIHQLLDIYIDGPPPLTNTWIIIIPQGLFLTSKIIVLNFILIFVYIFFFFFITLSTRITKLEYYS